MGLLTFFRRKSLVSQEEWQRYEYPREDGTRGFVAFDTGFAEEEQHEGWPHGRVVALLGDESRERAIDDAADALMDALSAARVRALLVGVHRVTGRVEYVFQVEAPEPFERVVTTWGATQTLPWALEPHQGWSYFDETLRPDERDVAYMEERLVLDQLREAGSDFSKPHDLEHVFLGTPAQLTTIAEALRERGFRVVEQDAATLTVARPLIIEQMDVTSTTMPLRKLAAAVGAQYDGWSCDVVGA